MINENVATTTGIIVDTIKENIIGALMNNLLACVVLGLVVISVVFVWKLFSIFLK